jgi:hypothetical protein
MKIYVYEVRGIADGNLEAKGAAQSMGVAVRRLLERTGVAADHVYTRESGQSVVRAFGAATTRDGIDVVFTITEMEVES